MACTSNAEDNLLVWVMANGKSVSGDLLIIIVATHKTLVDVCCNCGCFQNGNYVWNRTWFTWKKKKAVTRTPGAGGMCSCYTFRALVNFPKHPQGNPHCHFELCSTSRWGKLYGQTHVSSILINQLHRELWLRAFYLNQLHRFHQ